MIDNGVSIIQSAVLVFLALYVILTGHYLSNPDFLLSASLLFLFPLVLMMIHGFIFMTFFLIYRSIARKEKSDLKRENSPEYRERIELSRDNLNDGYACPGNGRASKVPALNEPEYEPVNLTKNAEPKESSYLIMQKPKQTPTPVGKKSGGYMLMNGSNKSSTNQIKTDSINKK